MATAHPRFRFAFRVLAPALLALACVPPRAPDDDPSSIRFSDLAEYQSQNLTTDLISVPEGLGMAAIDHGWQRQEGANSDDAWLTVTGKLGRLVIFSADGDLEEMELELSLGDVVEGQKMLLKVLINGQLLKRLRLESQWSSYSVLVPPELVRRGTNIVDLMPRQGKRLQSAGRRIETRVRRIRFRSSSGRPVWPARPGQIRVGDGIELPVASFVDWVLRVPQQARLLGSYEAEVAKPVSGPGYAYIQLLGESQTERTLLNRRLLKTLTRPQQLDLDLTEHAGQIVRLRVGTTGTANGIVRWRNLRVAASESLEKPFSLPPIGRSDISREGLLGQPDVFVILLDAARADAFSPFNGPHPTPATERLAADGTIFTQAFSPAPWTGQSVPGMLTGLYPDALRVGPLGSHLPDEIPTLPELMAANGYRTVLWSQHPLYRNHKSFQRGFQEIFRAPSGAYDHLPSQDQLIDEHRPTFAWIHLIPPHAPYQPPAPFRGLYSSDFAGSMSVEAGNLSQFPHTQKPESLSAAEIQYTKNRYLENVGFADSLVARLLTELERSGRYQNSIVVLLSDHGEAFLEHGTFLHTRHLHTELLHVPLVIKWPAGQQGLAATVTSPVSLVDLVPTLLDGLGLTGATEGFHGRSLIPEVLGDPAETPALYGVTRGVEDRLKAPKPQLMLQFGDWRLLYDPLADSSKLYQIDEDPRETVDLSATHPLQALRLRQSVLFQQHSNLQLLQAPQDEGAVEDMDPEVLENLKALGYLN